ncbi:hypothetical protein LTR08_007068 [Meristemomyces frigidus]|nr:hypothetical protein LTR08_007068 [Meristemomyces frigidus]
MTPSAPYDYQATDGTKKRTAPKDGFDDLLPLAKRHNQFQAERSIEGQRIRRQEVAVANGYRAEASRRGPRIRSHTNGAQIAQLTAAASRWGGELEGHHIRWQQAVAALEDEKRSIQQEAEAVRAEKRSIQQEAEAVIAEKQHADIRWQQAVAALEDEKRSIQQEAEAVRAEKRSLQQAVAALEDEKRSIQQEAEAVSAEKRSIQKEAEAVIAEKQHAVLWYRSLARSAKQESDERVANEERRSLNYSDLENKNKELQKINDDLINMVKEAREMIFLKSQQKNEADRIKNLETDLETQKKELEARKQALRNGSSTFSSPKDETDVSMHGSEHENNTDQPSAAGFDTDARKARSRYGTDTDQRVGTGLPTQPKEKSKDQAAARHTTKTGAIQKTSGRLGAKNTHGASKASNKMSLNKANLSKLEMALEKLEPLRSMVDDPAAPSLDDKKKVDDTSNGMYDTEYGMCKFLHETAQHDQIIREHLTGRFIDNADDTHAYWFQKRDNGRVFTAEVAVADTTRGVKKRFLPYPDEEFIVFERNNYKNMCAFAQFPDVQIEAARIVFKDNERDYARFVARMKKRFGTSSDSEEKSLYPTEWENTVERLAETSGFGWACGFFARKADMISPNGGPWPARFTDGMVRFLTSLQPEQDMPESYKEYTEPLDDEAVGGLSKRLDAEGNIEDPIDSLVNRMARRTDVQDRDDGPT